MKAADAAETKAKLDLLEARRPRRGARDVDLGPAPPRPDADELNALNKLTTAAKLDGIDVFVAVYNFGQQDDAADADEPGELRGATPPTLARAVPDLQNFIIGNEPNLNRFWLPQFNADGTDAAAPAYLALLAATYDGAEGGRPDDHGLRRRALAARDRPARHRPRHALADRLHRRPGRRLPRERPDAAR